MIVPVSIIIVNYHSESLIEAITRQLPTINFEYIIVDNSDTFPEHFLSSDFLVISPHRNLGFGPAVNLALDSVSREFTLILNPDVSIDLEAIVKLIETASTLPSLGAIAPRLVEQKHKGPFLNGGLFPNMWPIFCHFSFLSRLSHKYPGLSGIYQLNPTENSKELIVVEWISGAFMLLNSQILKELGGLSEDWFMYSEDLELCLRLRERNKLVLIDPGVVGVHTGGGSDERSVNSKHNTLWLNNLADFHFRYLTKGGRNQQIIWCLIVSFGFLLRTILEFILRIGYRNVVQKGTKNRRKEFFDYSLFCLKLAFRDPRKRGNHFI